MKQYTAKELAELVNGVVSGEEGRTISGVNSLKMAADTDVSFLSTIKYRKQLEESKAAIVLVEEGMKLEPTAARTLIFCENPDKAFTKICALFAQLLNSVIEANVGDPGSTAAGEPVDAEGTDRLRTAHLPRRLH